LLSVYEAGSGKVSNLPVVHPYTKDELVREINAEIPRKIGDKLVRPFDVARVLASQFNALGLDPAATIEQVV